MHRTNLAVLLALGTLWAALLVVGGSLLPSILRRAWPASGLSALLLGLTVVVAGQYVFLTVVADRLFPRASRRLVAGAELALGALMVALAGGAGVAAFAGGAAA